MARVGEWIPAHPSFGRYTLSVRLDLALTQRPFAALQLSEGLVAERLDVAPMVVGDERFDPVVCAQGDERVKERRIAVVQACLPGSGLTGRGFGSTADAAGAEWVCVCADLFERAGQRSDVGVGEVL